MSEEKSVNTYESQFTKDNILKMSGALNNAINEYAKNNIDGGKVDIFVLLAALGQTAYDVTMKVFPKDVDERKKAFDEMKLLTEQLIAKTDAHRIEFKTTGVAELLASAHFLSILSEFYCKRRDGNIQQIMEQQEQDKAPEEIETVEGEIVE